MENIFFFLNPARGHLLKKNRRYLYETDIFRYRERAGAFIIDNRTMRIGRGRKREKERKRKRESASRNVKQRGFRYPPCYLLFTSAYISLLILFEIPEFLRRTTHRIFDLLDIRLHPRLVRSIAFERRRSIVRVRFARCCILRRDSVDPLGARVFAYIRANGNRDTR